MTDKQIIVDGVDVSGCEWYSSTYFKPCDGCKNTPNCYYKQLQREKQNSQEARDTAIKEFNRAEELKTLLKRLEQENKELKEKNKNIKAHKDFLFKENDKLMRNNSIIRMALNEIKDITTNALSKQRPYKEDFIDIQDIINNAEKIVNKISEVLKYE